MTEKQKILIMFTEEAELYFSTIMEKYNLNESEESRTQKLLEGNLSKVGVIKKIIKGFVGNVISKEDFNASLAKTLSTDEKTTEMISKDITENLLPLIDKVTEDQLKEYILARDEKDEEKGQGSDLAQEILRKINAKRGILTAEPEGNPSMKAPTVSVEENAKQIQQIKRDLNPRTDQTMDEPAPAKPDQNASPKKTDKKVAENKFANEKKGPDSYREPIE